ncbi:DNA-processing protein DprA [Pimelobacter sp. 30-1]|uniref:DNA-processing protein DprA n=1 Tax=Pimelobacter sp. 30-1 TaxID=2004991 RepID=UPI001C051607|nr:DNA-processing protein DprA [Pimelobacter sp. 30-1]MBU2698793.1 hypothetical protein [Pimelobacter sp. 30-1]
MTITNSITTAAAHAPTAPVWHAGDSLLLDEIQHGITVTGSRSASNYGTVVAGDVTGWLLEGGYTVVTGAGFGIEEAVFGRFLATRAAGLPGRLVVVLTRSLEVLNPQHREMLSAVASRGGLLVSITELGHATTRQKFQQRNAWLGAATAGTIIVEAAARGACLETAAAAEAAERHLAAVPGPITSAWSEGTHHLIRHAAAHLVYDQASATDFGRWASEAARDRAAAAEQGKEHLG